MKVFILTEGGKDIGLGHITRCMALRQAFEKEGIKPEFIINIDKYIEEMVGNLKYQALNWLNENNKLFKMLNQSDIVIVDSYMAKKSIYTNVSNTARVPVYLDDTRRLQYPKGVVLNGSFYAEDLNYPKKDIIKYLLGIQYAILRKEFWEVSSKKINRNIENIMITFGGIDNKNMTLKIMRFLNNKCSDLKKLVIIGKSYQNIKDIESNAGKNTELIYFPNAEKMKKIMLISDVAISSGGQTLYELARVGVPTIGICVAENQVIGLEKLQKMDLIEYLGLYDDDKLESRLIKSINYLSIQSRRETRSKRAREFVDGKGCQRLIKKLISYP